MVAKTLISYNVESRPLETGFARVDLIEYETRIYSQINTCDGAAALIINDNREILMVNSIRPAVGEISWEIPRGGIDGDETPAQAAAREVAEETGYTVNPNHLLPLGIIHPDSGVLSTKIYLFLHKTSRLPLDYLHHADGIEVTEVKWVGKPRVVEGIWANQITDSVTIAALGKAVLLGIA